MVNGLKFQLSRTLKRKEKKSEKLIVFQQFQPVIKNLTIKDTRGFPNSSVGKESTCNAGDPGSIPGLGKSIREGIGYPLQYSFTSLVTQLVKSLPTTRETWVRSLGWEDSLEKGKGYPQQNSGLENDMDCIVYGLQRVGHNRETFIYFSKDTTGLDCVTGNTSKHLRYFLYSKNRNRTIMF